MAQSDVMSREGAPTATPQRRKKQRRALVIAACIGAGYAVMRRVFDGGELVRAIQYPSRRAIFEVVGYVLGGAIGFALLVAACIGAYNLLSRKSTWADRRRTLRNGALVLSAIAAFILIQVMLERDATPASGLAGDAREALIRRGVHSCVAKAHSDPLYVESRTTDGQVTAYCECAVGRVVDAMTPEDIEYSKRTDGAMSPALQQRALSIMDQCRSSLGAQ